LALYLALVLQGWSGPAVAASELRIAELYGDPPSPCIAKPREDRSSLVPLVPEGDEREEVIGIMGGLVAMFLRKGSERIQPANIAAVYTAVFYQDEPRNEIGVYAYRFRESIESAQFEVQPGLNGRILVIGGELLVLLWHEEMRRTGECFAAMARYFETLR
jgi:hypothetical protein